MCFTGRRTAEWEKSDLKGITRHIGFTVGSGLKENVRVLSYYMVV
jgi:hypothetical protein